MVSNVHSEMKVMLILKVWDIYFLSDNIMGMQTFKSTVTKLTRSVSVVSGKQMDYLWHRKKFLFFSQTWFELILEL